MRLEVKDFQVGIQHLMDQWGQNNFKDKRVALIYDEVKNLTSNQYKELINNIIASRRYAPLPMDIREAAAPFVAENNRNKKQKMNKASANFFNNQELKTLARTILKALEENDQVLYSKIIKGLSKINKAQCWHCNDSGVVYARRSNDERLGKSNTVFKCFCALGNQYPIFPLWNPDQSFGFKNINEITRFAS